MKLIEKIKIFIIGIFTGAAAAALLLTRLLKGKQPGAASQIRSDIETAGNEIAAADRENRESAAINRECREDNRESQQIVQELLRRAKKEAD